MLADLLNDLTPQVLAEDSARLLARPETDFVQRAEDVLPFLRPAQAA